MYFSFYASSIRHIFSHFSFWTLNYSVIIFTAFVAAPWKTSERKFLMSISEATLASIKQIFYCLLTQASAIKTSKVGGRFHSSFARNHRNSSKCHYTRLSLCASPFCWCLYILYSCKPQTWAYFLISISMKQFLG